MILDRRRRTIYRLYGDDDRLLYIGLTDSWGDRRAEHAKSKPWWSEVVSEHLIDITGTRRDAEVVEMALIHAEHPIYNLTHSPSAIPAVAVRECRQALVSMAERNAIPRDVPSICLAVSSATRRPLEMCRHVIVKMIDDGLLSVINEVSVCVTRQSGSTICL